jgi:5'(3')-deoxyribonucleotidase
MAVEEAFVLGLDLDGCVANFIERMRQIYAEWSGKDVATLNPDPTYGFPEWGLVPGEYDRLHRFAVTQRELFSSMEPLPGAPSALRRLSAEGLRIRIATHRLFIAYFHEPAASQTIRWLENHGIPYWDLCLIQDKAAIRADLFVEDSVPNIKKLESFGCETVCITNSTNVGDTVPLRAADWAEAEVLIRDRYYAWRTHRGLALPPGPGRHPPEGGVAELNDEPEGGELG